MPLPESHQRPLRLVILLQDLEFGGTQTYALTLLRHLDRTRFSPQLWTLRSGDDLLPDQAGNEVVRLTPSSWVSPPALMNLARRLKQVRPDILYTLTVTPNIWGRLIGKACGVPVMVSGYRAMHPRQHERWLWPLSRRIICNAQALKEIMISRHRVEPGRIAVIPNAVDADYFQPDPGMKASSPTVLYAGRLVRDKDPLTLIQAFARVVHRLPEARLIMLGNGPLKPMLRDIISEQSLEKHIALLPGVRDVRPFYKTAWMLASSSRREGCPNVILEAMASGLPVAATGVGGVPELVEHGRTGTLVRPGDHRDLAEAIIDILENTEPRNNMAVAARKRAHRFSIPDMVRRTETVLLDAYREASGG